MRSPSEVTSGLGWTREAGVMVTAADDGVSVPQGPSRVCASCVWARVRPRVSCSAAREPSGCRVRRGVRGRARAARAAGVGGRPRGMEAFQPLTSYTAACMCPDRASTRLADLGRGADLYPESRGGGHRFKHKSRGGGCPLWTRQAGRPTGGYGKASFQTTAAVWEGCVTGPGKGRGRGDG